TLRQRLTGDDEQHLTKRYSESTAGYQAYLQARHYCSMLSSEALEQATKHFQEAINLDPNYALAYAGIIDCYLRLATNYLPPEDDVPSGDNDAGYQPTGAGESDPRVKLRFEWDWKGAERELRRANELQTTYPTAPQWYAAYKTTR